MQGLLKYELSLWLIKEPSLPLLLAIDYLSHGRVSVVSRCLAAVKFCVKQVQIISGVGCGFVRK